MRQAAASGSKDGGAQAKEGGKEGDPKAGDSKSDGDPKGGDPKNGKAGDLQKELDALFNSQNKSGSKDKTSIPATFLRVTVSVK